MGWLTTRNSRKMSPRIMETMITMRMPELVEILIRGYQPNGTKHLDMKNR